MHDGATRGADVASEQRKEYERAIASLIQGFESDGEIGPAEGYLAENSRLPGPRGNLELADAFADAVGEFTADDAYLAWALSERLFISAPACDAPVNDPREFVAFCGAVAAGAVGAAEESYRSDALGLLRHAARDSRWRLREAAAMGLQRLLAVDFDRVADSLGLWVLSDDPLEMRAVVAAVAEPPLLRSPEAAATALELHRAVLGRLGGLEHGEAYKTLLQGLSYSLSVVAAADPDDGFALMHDLLADGCDHDARKIVAENVKKSRLRKPYPDRVEAVERLLIG